MNIPKHVPAISSATASPTLLLLRCIVLCQRENEAGREYHKPLDHFFLSLYRHAV